MPKQLTGAAIAQYHRDGYYTPINALDPQEAVAMRGALEAFEAQNGGPLKGSKRFKSHLLFRWLADLVRSPACSTRSRISSAPTSCAGPPHWWVKEPRSPSFVSWHQDSNYWGVDTDHLVSAWVALSPRDGGERVHALIPGSHHGPHCRIATLGTTTTC